MNNTIEKLILTARRVTDPKADGRYVQELSKKAEKNHLPLIRQYEKECREGKTYNGIIEAFEEVYDIDPLDILDWWINESGEEETVAGMIVNGTNPDALASEIQKYAETLR